MKGGYLVDEVVKPEASLRMGREDEEVWNKGVSDTTEERVNLERRGRVEMVRPMQKPKRDS